MNALPACHAGAGKATMSSRCCLISCCPAGFPNVLGSDNGSECTAKCIRRRLSDAGSITANIEPDRPWENGSIESFNVRMRDEFLNGERFDTLHEAQVLTQ